ncbi:MAG: 4-phosphoerythronate dehydrogenase PdxB [Bacteroidales bacterium]|nr:4-phosphoerythronate dehydrogenase PdxB [Bacteroidales bacterium]
MKIVADEKIPFLKGAFEPYADIEYYPGHKISREHLLDADALIIRTRTICNRDLLEGTNIQFIATATIGYDHIDTEYCRSKDIQWANAPGCNAASVKQYITCALLYMAEKNNFSLKDRTIGIVGVGNVGKKIGKIAVQLGMRVMLNDPPRERNENLCGFISLDGIIRESDIVTFHVPLNYEGEYATFHLADEKFFNRLNPGTILINSSRGEVVDTDALKKALQLGKVAGAVIDVWEHEPEIDKQLLQMMDIGTPHIAGYSADGKANGTTMSVQAVSKFFDLGIENWEPDEVPLPKNTEITIDCKNKQEQEIIKEAVTATYNIAEDDKSLRLAVRNFENLRANYPLRREFFAYTINLLHSNKEIADLLRQLEFNVKIV